ncbi:hypothetical protein M422DRAFT_45290 [Sphaerobolus stellatus SS14]|nr:hypothetical protein M422DRAFT_45290 [Sphaerobolus stellatus SS14]
MDDEREKSTNLSLIGSRQIVPVVRTGTATKTTEITHAVATRPHYTRQPLQDVMVKYGIPQLELALKEFLLQAAASEPLAAASLHVRARNFPLPVSWTLLSIWNPCTIIPPLVGFDEGVPEKRTVLARLHTKNDSTPRFQTVFIDPDVENPNPQDGIRGKFAIFLRK